MLIYLRLRDAKASCGCTKRQEKLNRIGDSVLTGGNPVRSRLSPAAL